MAIDYRNTLNSLTLDDLANWTEMGGGDVQGWLDAINSGGYDVSERQAIEDFAGEYINFFSNGDGTYTMTGFANQGQGTTTNPVNSNVTTINRGDVQTPINVSTDQSGKISMSTQPASGSFGQNAKYFLANVGQAVSAASTGIWLGKTIDSALYNANPDYWDSIGMWALNPETWSTITNGDDSLAAGLFNFVFGINPDTGKTQAYMEQNALAYMAYALAKNGWFGSGDPTYPYIDGLNVGQTIPVTAVRATVGEFYTQFGIAIPSTNPYNINEKLNFPAILGGGGFGSDRCIFYCAGGERIGLKETATIWVKENNSTYYTTESLGIYPSGANGQVLSPFRGGNDAFYPSGYAIGNAVYTQPYSSSPGLLFADAGPAVPEGVDNQTGATLPDTSTWSTPAATLSSLQQQYPQVFQNVIVWDNVQPDGTNPQLVYVPVPMPELQTTTDPVTGEEVLVVSQPVSDITDSSQADPQIDNDNSDSGIIDFLLRLIQRLPEPSNEPQTETEPDLKPVTNVRNPVNTGTGDSPSIPTPSGSASALWSVYHPTQQQIDSFGAWLWSGNIITQIQQLLQNPMEGIITLHKVFATPIDAGTDTIVVGRLDSQVSSATVEEQYVTVDCGEIELGEHFGNVFDYSPYTNVSLYLPFIGIVPLNAEDVMRSTIGITYGVDLFTGSCLAMVEVVRDDHTVVMYQYTGMASVEYPLTGSVHSGLINGLLSIAGGVAGVAAASTGVGVVAGASAIAGGLANANKSSNARSGSFSGNAGAMGIKRPYLIIQRPQTKIANTFPSLDGYPTNYSIKLSSCSNHVVCKTVHVSGISATIQELEMIESLLKSGIEI